MNEKRYYWLKLNEDFFDDDTIQFIEEQTNGIEYSNFYLKLCLKSLQYEGRLIRYVGETLIPYDYKTLSKLTGVKIDTVITSMKLFEEIGLVTQLDTGEIYMKQIDEMIGTETSAAIRKRKSRARASIDRNTVEALPEPVTELPDVTKSYTEIEKEKDIEKDIEKEPAKPVKARDGLDYQQIEKWYHEFCPELPTLRIMSESRKRTLKAWGDMDEIKEAFEIAGKSDFLNGKKTDFKAGFDWIIKPANRVKILEGFYNNHKAKGTAPDYSEMNEENKPDWVKKMESEYI